MARADIATFIFQNYCSIWMLVRHFEKVNRDTVFKIYLYRLLIKRAAKTRAFVIGGTLQIDAVWQQVNNLGFARSGHAGQDREAVIGAIVD